MVCPIVLALGDLARRARARTGRRMVAGPRRRIELDAERTPPAALMIAAGGRLGHRGVGQSRIGAEPSCSPSGCCSDRRGRPCSAHAALAWPDDRSQPCRPDGRRCAGRVRVEPGPASASFRAIAFDPAASGCGLCPPSLVGVVPDPAARCRQRPASGLAMQVFWAPVVRHCSWFDGLWHRTDAGARRQRLSGSPSRSSSSRSLSMPCTRWHEVSDRTAPWTWRSGRSRRSGS